MTDHERARIVDLLSRTDTRRQGVEVMRSLGLPVVTMRRLLTTGGRAEHTAIMSDATWGDEDYAEALPAAARAWQDAQDWRLTVGRTG